MIGEAPTTAETGAGTSPGAGLGRPRPQPDARSQRWAALVHAARSGQRDSLNQIVAELTPLLWQVARSQGLDRAAAEDAVQNTWLALLGHLDRIHTPPALVGWLVTVTRREAKRVRGNGQREQPQTDDAFVTVPDRLPVPEDQVLVNERDRVLWETLGSLDRRCQELLRIVAFADRPDYDVVAEALGMPRGSIGPTRGRCLAKLRDLLTADTQWSGK